jgi:uncharacterized OB-fold protein
MTPASQLIPDLVPVPVSDRLPGPVITSTNRPYWDAARRGEFQLPRCMNCQEWIYPFSNVCHACGTFESLDWVAASGRGKLSSWVVYRRAFAPFVAADVPYAIAEVELDEGPRLISSIVNSVGRFTSDMRLRVAFRPVTNDLTLVVFEPDAATEA